MIIGIDPDAAKCGVCWIWGGGSIQIESSSPWAICNCMVTIWQYHSVKIAIENVENIKPTFARKTNQAGMLKIAQNVGMVKQSARMMIETARMNGMEVILVPPGVGKQVKKNAKLFNELSGWQGRSNEDQRDAWAIATYAAKEIEKNG